MQVKLLQALHVEGKLYPLGVQDIPEQKLKHKHFLHYIKLGYIVEPNAQEVIVPESPKQRGARLHEKLHKASKPAKAEPVEEELPASPEPDEELAQGEPTFDEAEAEESSDEKDQPKKNKHKQKR